MKKMLVDKSIIKAEAVFSEDRSRRYLLRKEWDSKKPKATIIMTNPSTADMLTMDYTTLYIMNNVVKLDFGSIDIVNLISKMTRKLNVKEDLEVEEENLSYIFKSAEKSDKVIIAWGKLGENNKRVRDVQDALIKHITPFADKLCEIACESGESGFHPLAPQVRFFWGLTKYKPPKTTEKTKKTPENKAVEPQEEK